MRDFLASLPPKPTSLTFALTEAQTARYYAWRQTIDEQVFTQQLTTGMMMADIPLDSDVLAQLRQFAAAGVVQPYYGAIGGAYSFTFTPNALGIGVHVRNRLSGDELSLTESDSW